MCRSTHARTTPSGCHPRTDTSTPPQPTRQLPHNCHLTRTTHHFYLQHPPLKILLRPIQFHDLCTSHRDQQWSPNPHPIRTTRHQHLLQTNQSQTKYSSLILTDISQRYHPKNPSVTCNPTIGLQAITHPATHNLRFAMHFIRPISANVSGQLPQPILSKVTKR